jgi:tripartite-type tricarboxylate transporter receptor subunit TctC
MGLAARGGTPAPIIALLSKALNDALDTPQVRSSLETLQSEVVKGTPDEFRAIVEEDVAYWNKAIGDARIKLE